MFRLTSEQQAILDTYHDFRRFPATISLPYQSDSAPKVQYPFVSLSPFSVDADNKMSPHYYETHTYTRYGIIIIGDYYPSSQKLYVRLRMGGLWYPGHSLTVDVSEEDFPRQFMLIVHTLVKEVQAEMNQAFESDLAGLDLLLSYQYPQIQDGVAVEDLLSVIKVTEGVLDAEVKKDIDKKSEWYGRWDGMF